MAAPTKDGLSYFNCECYFEDNVELVVAEFGMKGLGILVKLWQKIYSISGYYCEWNDDVALMFSRNNGEGVNVVSEVIGCCLRRGLFDCGMYNDYKILTSRGIQKRYLEASKRRKVINFKSEYLLIDIPSDIENVNINSINVNINSQNECNNSQSKVNKSKVNKSIESMSTGVDARSPFDYQSVINSFNSICVSLPKVKNLTPARKKKIKNVGRLLGDISFDEYFKSIENSDFLSGRNGKWTGCNFDWILKPSNLIKIIEGNYNNKGEETKRDKTSYELDKYENYSMFDEV